MGEAWNEIALSNSQDIQQLDLTSSFEWAMSLWESHLQNQKQAVLVLREGEAVIGVFPLHANRRSIRGVPCRSFQPISELYSGRTGFLFRELRAESLLAMLDFLRGKLGAWDTFSATVVQGGVHETILLEAARQRNWRNVVLERVSSPYIPFLETWENHFAALPKKLRSTMRNGEKRLRERGELAYREFVSPDEMGDFNSAVRSIENDSWKATRGTSIASNLVHEAFHSAFTLKAAQKGWFSGHVLFLDRKPVAYIMGLLHKGVFLDLKESYCSQFREMSPGHVLKSFAFARLYQRQTRWYDFMGKCEEYKMKWTDKTYTRITYLIFSNTFRGRLARLLGSGWRAASAFSAASETNTSESVQMALR